jgi:cell division protein FtsB
MLLTAAVAVYAVVHLSGPNGVKALLERREAMRAIQEENRQLEDVVAAKAKYVEDVKAKKPEVIIPLIRDRTNWVRPGERDFRMPENQPTRKQPAPAAE